MERDRAPLTALRDESRALSAVLRQADPQDFDRPTNCPPGTSTNSSYTSQ
jgi:hypothetical protein